jgi:hypothetical protein
MPRSDQVGGIRQGRGAKVSLVETFSFREGVISNPLGLGQEARLGIFVERQGKGTIRQGPRAD